MKQGWTLTVYAYPLCGVLGIRKQTAEGKVVPVLNLLSASHEDVQIYVFVEVSGYLPAPAVLPPVIESPVPIE
jgi:hypothetical protein